MPTTNSTVGTEGRWILRPTPPPAALSQSFGLGPRDAAEVASMAVAVEFQPGETIQQPSERVTDCLFVIRGMATSTCARHGTESDIVIAPDIVNVTTLMGIPGTGHAVRAVTSLSAYRVEAAALSSAMDANPALRSMILTVAGATMERLRRRAACHLVHGPEERLAAWLLHHHDTGHGPLRVTHDFLAALLGVRRPTVTVTLHALESVKALTARRSCIEVRDPWRLRERACTCHGPFPNERATDAEAMLRAIAMVDRSRARGTGAARRR